MSGAMGAPKLARIDLRGRELSPAALRGLVPRGGVDVDSTIPKVEPILADVRARGAAAALDHGERFDGVRPESVRVPEEVLERALQGLDSEVRRALEAAAGQIRAVHEAQRPSESTVELAAGQRVTERFVPVERVGLYVPGGKAVYPSSVLMNVIPAQAAGVGSVVVASPPQREHGGWPHPTTLAACRLLGVDEVWAVGGAQAVGLLAYGDESQSLEAADLVTGPGNIFVAAAKRLVRGVVGTDAEAGPTEIAILADETADPRFVAADLLSQAEHDPMAASVLITDSEALADAVDGELAARAAATRHAERVAEALGGQQSATILVEGLEQGVAVADAYAAEHLEIHTADAESVAARIRHAGAIFVGPYSPVPLGDYAAGSNHVLPTSGTARFNPGLSTHTFLRPVNVVTYSKQGLAGVAGAIAALAEAEDLPAHAEAVAARLTDDEEDES